MNEVTILIAEDKPISAEYLVDRLESFGYHSLLGPFARGEEALKTAKKHLPSIALLDIQLKGDMNGIALARELQMLGNIPIIYLTNLQDHQTFEDSQITSPVSFLNKPFTNNELRTAISLALRTLEMNPPLSKLHDLTVVNDRIFVSNGRGKIPVFIKDILWIRSGGGEKSVIVVERQEDNEDRPYFSLNVNLNKLEERLAPVSNMVRCSRYHIINLKKVVRLVDNTSKIKNRKSVVIDGEEIMVGDVYRKAVLDKLVIL